MRSVWKKSFSHILAVLLFIGGSASSGAAGVNVSYLYNLSNFFGPLPYNWAIPFVDREKNEIFVIDSEGMGMSVFNENGMETYRFEGLEQFGSVLDGAVDEDGNIVLLVSAAASGPVLIRCNYRGEPVARININAWSRKNLPAEFSDFSPDRVVIRRNLIYLADTERMKIVVAGSDGAYKASHDIGGSMKVKEAKLDSMNLVGFSADGEGNIYFTIPVIFKAYRLSPDGKISGFGKPGSQPGSFGIVAGIDTDMSGNIFVLDTLRCVVMVFNMEFRFLREFGGGGRLSGGLVAPRNLVIDSRGMVYVAQAAKRGISVFKVSIQ